MTKYEELQSLIEQMISSAGSGHFSSSMSALQIMYPLFYEQGITPDCFILSKGHAAPALYAILYDLGYIKDLSGFRKYDGLPGHPELGIPGVTASSGSLGMGISKAIGLAYANPDKIYHVLVGDGELQEGQNWEAIAYAHANGVSNVHVHVDCNGHQYSGKIPDELYIHKYLSGNFITLHVTDWQRDNSYLTTPDPAMEPYRQNIVDYSVTLQAHMMNDMRIVTLNADLEHDFGLTIIKKAFRDRYIQCGISEQHMVSMANGLALAGKIPICHTFGAFYRQCFNQLYNNCCDNLPIMYTAGLCGTHPTTNIGHSHFDYGIIINDLLPNLIVCEDMDQAFSNLGKHPVYLILEYPARKD